MILTLIAIGLIVWGFCQSATQGILVICAIAFMAFLWGAVAGGNDI